MRHKLAVSLLIICSVGLVSAQEIGIEIQVDSQTGTAYGLAWNPDGTILAVASGHELTLYNVDLDTILETITEEESGAAFIGAAWSPDGTQIATASGYRHPDILIWDWDNELVLTKTLAGDDPAIPAEWRARNQYGLTWGEGGLISLTDDREATFQFWDVDKGELVGFHNAGYAAPVYHFSWAENNLAMIAAGRESDSEDFAIFAMDAAAGNSESLFILPEQPSAIAILNDSITAVAYPDGRVELISVAVGITIRTFIGVDQPVGLSWNGTTLAILGYETDLQLWDLTDVLP